MYLLIGNGLSFAAAMFMLLSSWVKERKTVFFFQFLECGMLAVASYFFGSYAGITTLVLSSLRNLLVSKNKFTKPVMILFLVLVTVSGLWANNRGLIGLMPIIATIEYTICCHYITGVKATKYSIIANCAIWSCYSLLILDISTAVSDATVIVVACISIFKMNRQDKINGQKQALYRP